MDQVVIDELISIKVIHINILIIKRKIKEYFK